MSQTIEAVRSRKPARRVRKRKGTRRHTLSNLHFKDTVAAIAALKAGLPFSTFVCLQKEMDIPAKELAKTVNIVGRTLARRQKEKRLKTDESERVLRIAKLFARAVEVLGGNDAARYWFKAPQRAFAGKTPLEYADTEPGAAEVADLLGRLEYGVFS